MHKPNHENIEQNNLPQEGLTSKTSEEVSSRQKIEHQLHQAFLIEAVDRGLEDVRTGRVIHQNELAAELAIRFTIHK